MFSIDLRNILSLVLCKLQKIGLLRIAQLDSYMSVVQQFKDECMEWLLNVSSEYATAFFNYPSVTQCYFPKTIYFRYGYEES
jgi:hypothetical protein